MNRRTFFSTVSSRVAMALPAAALTAAWPGFLRSAFAARSPDGPPSEDALDGLAVVSDGFRRAARAGKPLLVLIIPQDDSAKWTRGRSFGAWLNHGTAEQLAPLALCEVACARMDDLRRLVPTVGLSEPLMVLVETDVVPATVTRLDARLPEAAAGGASSLEDWREQQQSEDRLIDRQIATLSRLSRQALVEGEATLSRRAAQTRGVLPDQVLAQLSGLAGGGAPVDLIDSGAAILWSAPLPSVEARAACYKGLADAARARLSKQRVPGSHWATSHGCGTRVEGHPEQGLGIMCGMGHVPAKSSRFLYFYTVAKDPKKSDQTIL